jgi:hypothetical protein
LPNELAGVVISPSPPCAVAQRGALPLAGVAGLPYVVVVYFFEGDEKRE